jgi:dTDP-4-amino-4,6-dideoxygalactose transaminase
MIARIYEEGLRAIGARPVEHHSDVDPVFLRYPVMVNDKPRTLASARKARIELGDWFLSPVHPKRDHWEIAGYEKGSCPIAEEVCAHVVNLPIHGRVDVKEAARTLDFIRACVTA